MEVVYYLALLFLAGFSRGEVSSMREKEEGENDVKANNDENIAFESFGSPVYGINNFARTTGLNGKSGYNTPVPGLSASYAAYLSSLGYPYSYGPYNRYGMSPYSYPSLYGYGSPLLNNPAFSSALMSGLGFAGYGSPYFGRSVYPGMGYGYSPYNSGLGYRFGGLGYAPAALRGSGPVPDAPVPIPAVPAPVPRVPGSVAALPPRLPAVPNALPAAPAPFPGTFPYRGPFRGKDGTVRYGYSPADVQGLPAY